MADPRGDGTFPDLARIQMWAGKWTTPNRHRVWMDLVKLAELLSILEVLSQEQTEDERRRSLKAIPAMILQLARICYREGVSLRALTEEYYAFWHAESGEGKEIP